VDKKVILAVAGSGKTSLIVGALSPARRTLILTYTDNNIRNLRRKILEKFGCMPSNMLLMSYFSFLHSFCFKPFLWRKYRTSGINWAVPPRKTLLIKRTEPAFYIDADGRLYHNRISKLFDAEDVLQLICDRPEKYFDCLFIDEVQDLGGHDFNFLGALAVAKVEALFVGDFYQHTFDTSRDGNVNKNLHAHYEKYKERLRAMGLSVDETTLKKSYRCSPSVCAFVSDRLGIHMESHQDKDTVVCLIDDRVEAQKVLGCCKTVKLFYQKHRRYGCYSRNWGDSKGEDQYYDVCVVLNKETCRKFRQGDLVGLRPQTKNKLYVACARAKNDLYLLPEELIPRRNKSTS